MVRPVNAKVDSKIFDELYEKVIKSYDEISNTKTYIFDGFAGADHEHTLQIRVISKKHGNIFVIICSYVQIQNNLKILNPNLQL